jgi:hypothetical protein
MSEQSIRGPGSKSAKIYSSVLYAESTLDLAYAKPRIEPAIVYRTSQAMLDNNLH